MDCRSRGRAPRSGGNWVHSVELIMALKEGVIIDMSFVQVDDRLDMNFESLLGKGSAN